MPTIPVVIKTEEDELMYSWVLRIAKENGFTVTRNFINAFITPNATESEKSRRVLPYELDTDFDSIWKVADLSNRDKMDFFLDTGIYSFYAMFMTREQQIVMINDAFHNNAEQRLVSTTKTKLIPKIRLCPECMKEDVKKHGYFYYRRAHQLPGVTVCSKHGVQLLQYGGIAMHELDDAPNLVPVTIAESSKAYAKYCKDLLDAKIDCNADSLKAVLREEISRQYRGKKEDTVTAVIDKLKFPSAKQLNNGWKCIYSDQYLKPENTIPLIMTLFPDIRMLKDRFQPFEIPEELKTLAQERACTIISKPYSYLMELKHSCGNVICIHPVDFLNAWNCPKCTNRESKTGKTTESKGFPSLVIDLTGNEYTVISDCQKQNDKAVLRHNTCGTVFSMKAATFLNGGRCKKCNQQLREEQFRKLVSDLSNDEYQVAERRSYNLYTIRNVNTGRSVDLTRDKTLQELRRPTPSDVLPLRERGQESTVETEENRILSWIEVNCPKHHPIFLTDIRVPGLTYQIVKARISKLCTKKQKLEKIGFGIYAYPGDHFTDDEIITEKYLCRNGRHIGYPTGESALSYLGISNEKPEAYRLVTNIETATNVTGRTTTFLGHKLRIHGSPVTITEDNWKVLMILDVVCNIKKYLHGKDETRAYKVLQQYVRDNRLTAKQFSMYQGRYAFSFNAVRRLFAE